MTASPDEQPPGAAAILPGLRWSIKRSFVDYISHAPGGRATLRDGAFATGSREVVFPYDASQGDGESPKSPWFRGGVVFSAHSGVLLVRVDSPQVELSGRGGALTIADPFDRSGQARRLLATFDVGCERLGPFERWTGTAVRLAPESTALFNEVYPAGAEFDPLTIVLPAYRAALSG